MATYTTDYIINQSDGWVLVATNPSELIITPSTHHAWYVAILDSGTPAATLVGTLMGTDDTAKMAPYRLTKGVTGLVYVKTAIQRLAINVTATFGTGGGGVIPVVTTETDGSGTITAGGVSQDVFAAGVAIHGWAIQNQSAGDLYVRQSTASAATADQNSVRVPAGMEYVSDYINGQKVKIFGATTGQAFWAKAW